METLIDPIGYHSLETWNIERERLFHRTWQYMALSSQLPKHQDFVTRQIGLEPVVLQNFDGELKAFRNICSHRFNRIQTEARGSRALRCQYHGWTYDAEGTPVGIPQRPRFDGLSLEKLCELRLVPWRVESCGGAVFVCADATAMSLRQYLGDAYSTIELMTNACGQPLDENVLSIRANWKVLVENTLESYHVGFVHPTSFGRLGLNEGAFAWQRPHSSWTADLNPGLRARLEKVSNRFVGRTWQTPGYFHQLVFPNLTIASTQGMSFSIQLFDPVASDETLFTSTVFEARMEGLSTSDRDALDVMNQSVVAFNRTVFSEDREVCEHVQSGLAHAHGSGLLSDEELRVLDFQQRYMEYLDWSTS